MDRLLRHPWPGNVRELENIIQRAVVLTRGSLLDEAILEEILPPPLEYPLDKAEDDSFKTRIEAVRALVEKKMIQEALRKEKGKRTAIAKRLGISRKNLYNKMRKYDLL